MRNIITLCIALLACNNLFADTLIHAGRLIDGVADSAVEDVTIRVSGAVIAGVERGFIEPDAGDTVVDLRQSTVLPGLMDMHVHLTGEYSQDSRLAGFITNEADYAFDAAMFARRTLLAGFTVVRNPGDAYNVTIALDKAIRAGKAVGPLIFSAGKGIGTTGGHADPTNGWAKSLMGDPGPERGVVNGVADARRAVRQRYKDGAGFIKITATGGVLSVAKSGQNPQFAQDELDAIVETAADYGMHVAAHAHGTEGMKRAVLAGVASIEHGTYMDDEVMALMKERGTYYVPTILAGDWIAEQAKIDGFFPELVRPKAAAIGPVIQQTFASAYAAGVPIMFGTDSGVSPHGENAREFGLMVESGMPEMEAIQSATIVPARFLGIDATHGSIEVGKTADIVAVPGNPLEDIGTMTNVEFVMKGGVIHPK